MTPPWAASWALRRSRSAPSSSKISAEAAAKAVEAGKPVEGRSANDVAIKLDRKTTAHGAYPVVLVSYHVVCTTYDKQETVDLVKAFENYVVSEAGQKTAADAAKSAPLSTALAGEGDRSHRVHQGQVLGNTFRRKA